MSKIVKLNVSGIDWDIDEGEMVILPTDEEGLEIETSDDYDPAEMWVECDEMRTAGYDLLCEDVVEELSSRYGWCINGIDEITILEII